MAGSAIIPSTSTESSTRTVNSKPRTRYSKSYQGGSRIQTVKKSGAPLELPLPDGPMRSASVRAPLDALTHTVNGDCGHVGHDGGHVGHG